MGWFSSACSAVGSFVSGVCSGISRAASFVGSSVASVATSIANLGVELAGKVGQTTKAVAEHLDILTPEEKLEELGEKAMLSDNKPESYDSFNDYINHLRNDVPIDQEKLATMDEKELMVRSSIGASITLKGINERLGTVVTPEFMATVAKQDLTAKEIVATIEGYKAKDLNPNDYSLYIDDELSLDESSKHSSALVEAYQKLEPELSLEQIEDRVMGLK